jgi:thioredoxin reductase (NADPH)
MARDDGQLFDVTIIGAGPTGLFAAFCAGMRGMSVKVIERLPSPGGQLTVLYPDKYIYDSPGYPEILARDLASALYRQAFTFGEPVFRFEEEARALHRTDEGFLLLTDRGEHRSRAIIVAAGIGAFTPKQLGIPGTEPGSPGIHYFVRDLDAFRGRRVLVVGGGDSAVDWALALRDRAASVTLIHRRDVFRAHEASVRELLASPVAVKLFRELKAVEHAGGQLRAVTIVDNRTGAEERLEVDDVIFALGFEADLGALRTWGLELDAAGRHVAVDPSMATNIPGVFAAGDVTELTYLQKLELPPEQRVEGGGAISIPTPKYAERRERWGLLVVGYAQAAQAVSHARRYLDPKARLFPGHSSELAAARSG